MASKTAPQQSTTQQEVRQFVGVESSCDPNAFSSRNQEFVQASLNSCSRVDDQELARTLANSAASLRTDKGWTPHATDVQRGRAIMMDAFKQPSNLSLREFAALAGRSREHIAMDINARRLLALKAGPTCQKLPDWQLDETKRALTELVLAAASELDSWTIYRALSQPYDYLGGQTPVEAVTPKSIASMVVVALNWLGIEGQARPTVNGD